MDFSLLQSHAHHRYLRDIRALKTRWPYYLIMILDPILRFNWIFYAIFTHDTQHSSIASFLIGFAEVTRRGMWTLLRVENEHCSNVAQYKASRDVPLPYQIDTGVEPFASARVSSESAGTVQKQKKKQQAQNGQNEPVSSPSKAAVNWTGDVLRHTPSGKSTGVDVPGPAPTWKGGVPAATSAGAGAEVGAGPSAVEEGQGQGQGQGQGSTPGEESLRMRRRQRADTLGRWSITRILADAHKQDFEKKRRPADSGKLAVSGEGAGSYGEVDVEEEEEEEEEDYDEDMGATDDDDDETGSLLDERMEVREAEMLTRRARDSDVE